MERARRAALQCSPCHRLACSVQSLHTQSDVPTRHQTDTPPIRARWGEKTQSRCRLSLQTASAVMSLPKNDKEQAFWQSVRSVKLSLFVRRKAEPLQCEADYMEQQGGKAASLSTVDVKVEGGGGGVYWSPAFDSLPFKAKTPVEHESALFKRNIKTSGTCWLRV